MRKKHFLIVGLGSIGRRHMQNIAARHPDARFTVLRHRAAPDDLCKSLNADITQDKDEAIDGEYDLAIIASPSANHIDTLPGLIERGTPLLVEKPIVTSLSDCDWIERLLATSPRALRVAGFNFRHLRSLQQMRDMIRSGLLGRIVRASFTAGRWLPDWRPGSDYLKGYSADSARGGGVEMDLVHEIDIARWFFGEMDLQFALGRRMSALGLRSNDVASMIMTGKPSGPVVQISLDYVSRQTLRHYEVVGDQGGLCWDIRGTLDHITPQGRHSIRTRSHEFDIAGTYKKMIDAIDRVSQCSLAQENLQTLQDGLRSTRLAIMARDAGTERGL